MRRMNNPIMEQIGNNVLSFLFEGITLCPFSTQGTSIREESPVISADLIMLKYSKKPRRISQDEYLNLHIYSLMLRVGVKLRKEIGANPHLVKQFSNPFGFFNDYFTTDEGAFLWGVEQSKWDFRLHCQVIVC